MNNFIVGNPSMPYFSPISRSVDASSSAITIVLYSSFNFLANSIYLGAKALQCPHHGA